MLYYFTFLVPFIAALAAWLFSRDTELWWAYLLVAVGIDGLLHLFFWLLSTAKEYLSGYVTASVHYNAWTERVVRIETRNVNGRTVSTQRVEYVRHPDSYAWRINTGREFSVDYSQYIGMAERWHAVPEFYPVHHFNCVAGGDGEICHWNGNELDTETVTYTHRYRNPVRYSNSIFSEKHISKKEAQKLNLIDYPKINGFEQKVVLCQPGLELDESLICQSCIQRINAFCGQEHQIHVFVLLFKADQGLETAYRQHSYWKGLNKNEFVVCLGIDGDEVRWCQPFSWMDEPTLAVWTKAYFRDNPKLDLDSFSRELRNNIGLWKRKQFSDFKYLGINLSKSNRIVYGCIVALLAAATVVICLLVTNSNK